MGFSNRLGLALFLLMIVVTLLCHATGRTISEPTFFTFLFLAGVSFVAIIVEDK